jgi:hypothetical protein
MKIFELSLAHLALLGSQWWSKPLRFVEQLEKDIWIKVRWNLGPVKRFLKMTK